MMVESPQVNGMAPVDPSQLLKALGALLGDEGSVKGTMEMERINSLMKDANKLVSRSVYINILRATKETEVLEQFIEQGGWDTLYSWLKDAKASDNQPLLLELLQLYQQLPVTVELLKQNSCPKTIKSLSRSDDKELKSLAVELVDTWMKIIKGRPGSDSSQSSDKSKKTKHHHHHHKKKEESPNKASTKTSKLGSLPSVAEKDNDIPAGNSETASKSSAPASKKSITISSSNSEQSESTCKTRPKTVKTVPTQFRMTGKCPIRGKREKVGWFYLSQLKASISS